MNLKNKIILAPMVEVNNIAFRKLCTDYGADIVYSQMIDSRAFLMGSRKLSDFHDEKNVIAQFLGNNPEILAKCAKEIESKVEAIDLNLGCPHSNVVKRNAGSYLMKYPKKIESIIKALVKSVKLPITVKIRAGYDKNNLNAVKIAKLCEKHGASAIAVHGRARTVNYSSPVDYSIIKKVKQSVNIPVIGNGDILSPEDAKNMLKKTGCDSIMIARAAITNPFIFTEIKDSLKNKESKHPKKIQIFKTYLKYCKKYKIQFKSIKNHAQWFTKGTNNGAKYREMMNQAKDIKDLKEIYDKIK